jgi:acyl dehydratase
VTAALDPRTVRVGQELPPLVKGPITKDDLRAYAAASGDPNPMHTDDEFARNAGYAGVFAHGMLSMGYLGEFLVRAAGAGALRRFRTRFAKLTWPGEVITCRGTVTRVSDEGAARVVECDIWTENQTGERKLTGSAVLVLGRA